MPEGMLDDRVPANPLPRLEELGAR